MTDTTDARWTPRDGFGWGEGTVQGRKARGDESAPEWWTDAYEMRMRFGVPQFDAEAFQYEIYPDRLIHEKPAEETSSAGGTDWLKVGERGCGKSTDNLHWSLRLMEVNDEKVVWRGSPSRSEWLMFAPWTTVWLPRNADVSARWVYESPSKSSERVTAGGLEEIAREVRYYDDVLDVVEQIGAHPEGTFNVVYPDPSFAGCAELTRRTSRTSETLPFTPEWIADEGESGTPLVHWWFAFALARVEFADNYGWTSLMFDEMGELTPPNAEQDEHRTFKKLLLFQSLMIDSRRHRFSLFGTCHRETQVHWMILEEFMTRIDMPDGTPNPQKGKATTIPQGFKTVPMYADIMSDRKPGVALMYSENEFSLYRWADLKSSDDREDRVLKLEFSKPSSFSKSPAGTEVAG
ncbi:hypothetical protein [Natronolimnohabitans innermongolicus]|uniref:Uncharacterized protein n=1 Tax=Natronolimnohabitans innermongolicus JCM 12255 TaxID=1227499 RepID=L9WE06_9EURY|nr:hypothetical protein [Natronolimnohabitans innermongolicus]ELY47740.1 hypothetical protein C493_22231 [Natronolimnohabitans innermongolicus JCM 12255]